ncbi:dUTP diphosphatase [Planococcus sp. SE5232]|uniref:dUTP diphosphatase n=1 Tax=unclassified Planococcus (in: firmicutes) TaxID=2662419 RepID=UPI003D6B22A7
MTKIYLTELFETQRLLDAEIERKHPRIPDEDRLEKRVLALLVELGECANEWRGFKFWSNRQTANTLYQTTCDPDAATHHYCEDCKEDVANKDTLKHFKKCEGVLYPLRAKNPLLEEYVDCVHFALSIGLQLNIPLNLEWGPYRKKTVTEQFKDLLQADWETYYPNVYHGYCRNMELLIGLGEMLGFTWEQIETAYMSKNVTNWKRQEEGY